MRNLNKLESLSDIGQEVNFPTLTYPKPKLQVPKKPVMETPIKEVPRHMTKANAEKKKK